MKHLLLTTIAAVVLVGCGESQQSAPAPEVKPAEPVAEAAQPKPPTAKAPDISIHEAAEKGKIEMVKQHLAAGADVNAKDGIGGTPLYIAAFYGSQRTRDLLRQHGGKTGDFDGWTPLNYAAFVGHKEIAELLIAAGADVNAKDDDGKTPLDWAEKVRHADRPKTKAVKKETANLLRKHGGKTGEELKAEGK